MRRAQRLADEHPDWAFLYQYGNEANPRAHYETHRPRDPARRAPTSPTSSPGSAPSGTLHGRRHVPEGAQARRAGAAPSSRPPGELVEGLRNLDDGYIPPVYEKWGGQELLDGKRIVRPRESIEWTRRLVAEAGVFAGISSGAALAGAAKAAERIDEGTIVFIVCDGGWKYLSTGAYTDDLDAAESNAEKVIYF